MNERRKEVLEMLAAGRITAEEAEQLIAALENGPRASSGIGPEPEARPKPKYLRVVVDAEGETAPTKANIRVPMQLLRAGVKLAGLIPPQAREHVNDALRQKGIPFDVSQIKPENLEELIEQLHDLTIDVDGQVKVAVFCE
ncbi:MAG TPA: hypothetical protein VK738_14850 [Terriglobales bacterium]|jgi:hypothetical protein|nr:hypothetical protein [Terriglobales bacterium]